MYMYIGLNSVGSCRLHYRKDIEIVSVTFKAFRFFDAWQNEDAVDWPHWRMDI